VDKAIFVEYAVDSMRDFTVPAVEKRAAVLAPFSEVVSVLNDLLGGKIDPGRAGALVEKAALPSEYKRTILSLLGKKSSPSPLPPKQSRDPGIVNVLAMMDLQQHGGETGAPSPTDDASSALFTAVAEDSAVMIPRRELEQQRAGLEEVMHRQAEEIVRADFFSRRCASWSCLRRAVSAIGRTKGITMSVFSRGRDALDESLAQALASSSEQGLAPDIILIDDEYSFSTADISRLESAATAASEHFCSVVASIDARDELFTDIHSRDTLAHFFDDIRFLPFKKLRANPLSRSLSLCGPRITVGEEEPVIASASWCILFGWINAFLSGQSLFDGVHDQAASLTAVAGTVDIPLPIVKEAADWGLTLIGSVGSAASALPIVTLVDEQAAHGAYSRLGYNLAVNRIAKLAAIKYAAARNSGIGDRLTDEIRTYIVRQLAPYDVLSSADAVSVEADDRHSLTVTVDSEKAVCGYPLYVQFSL
jgi:hypothetical protein